MTTPWVHGRIWISSPGPECGHCEPPLHLPGVLCLWEHRALLPPCLLLASRSGEAVGGLQGVHEVAVPLSGDPGPRQVVQWLHTTLEACSQPGHARGRPHQWPALCLGALPCAGAAGTHHRMPTGLEQPRVILLPSWSSEAQNGCPWAGTMVWAGLGSLDTLGWILPAPPALGAQRPVHTGSAFRSHGPLDRVCQTSHRLCALRAPDGM